MSGSQSSQRVLNPVPGLKIVLPTASKLNQTASKTQNAMLFTSGNPRFGAIYVSDKNANPIPLSLVRENQPTGEEIAKGIYGSTKKPGHLNPATSARINPVSQETFAKSQGMGGAKKKAAKKTTKKATKAKTTSKKAKK